MDTIDRVLAESQPQTCGTCVYVQILVNEQYPQYPTVTCHRYPVSVVDITRNEGGRAEDTSVYLQFPSTTLTDFCGEWDARKMS